VAFAGETHVGRKRAHNEDNFHLPAEERLAIVADGMGGHASGEVASKLAVDTVIEYFRASAEEPAPTWPFKMNHGLRSEENRLVTGIKLANARIWETAHASAAQHGMGTTVVAALFLDDGRALVAHVGDSRVYRFREGRLEQLTDDHSLLNDYMKLKGLRADEVTDFPQKNVIVRALGMKETVQVDLSTDQPRVGDVYVLCSDGLSGMISDGEIAEILGSEPDIDAASQKLIALANDHGGVDNVTVLLAQIQPNEPAKASAAG
jgi:protein phosphatase